MESAPEPIDYAEYGALMALMSALGSIGPSFVGAMESGDTTTIYGAYMVFNAIIAALEKLPVQDKGEDARQQLLFLVCEYRKFAADIIQGAPHPSASVGDMAESQAVLDMALDRFGRRLGFGRE